MLTHTHSSCTRNDLQFSNNPSSLAHPQLQLPGVQCLSPAVAVVSSVPEAGITVGVLQAPADRGEGPGGGEGGGPGVEAGAAHVRHSYTSQIHT